MAKITEHEYTGPDGHTYRRRKIEGALIKVHCGDGTVLEASDAAAHEEIERSDQDRPVWRLLRLPLGQIFRRLAPGGPIAEFITLITVYGAAGEVILKLGSVFLVEFRSAEAGTFMMGEELPLDE